jgi:hypothetical protein
MQTLALLDAIYRQLESSFFYSCFFSGVEACAGARMSALNFLARRIPKLREASGIYIGYFGFLHP